MQIWFDFMAPEFSAEMEGGTKYDSSVDVFSLGLVHLVVLESERTLRDLIPLLGKIKNGFIGSSSYHF